MRVPVPEPARSTGDSADGDVGSVRSYADDDEFLLGEITDDGGSFGVLNSVSDRYAVQINTSAIEGDAGLDTGDTLQSR